MLPQKIAFLSHWARCLFGCWCAFEGQVATGGYCCSPTFPVVVPSAFPHHLIVWFQMGSFPEQVQGKSSKFSSTCFANLAGLRACWSIVWLIWKAELGQLQRWGCFTARKGVLSRDRLKYTTRMNTLIYLHNLHKEKSVLAHTKEVCGHRICRNT